MTAADRLCALHSRLISDRQTAFTGEGPANVRPTPAGSAWLADYRRYRVIFNDLERNGHDPADTLSRRFGYVTDLPPDESEPDRPQRPAQLDLDGIDWLGDPDPDAA